MSKRNENVQNIQNIPSLVQTLLLKHPSLIHQVKRKGWITSFSENLEKVYFEHPRSFSSRFLSLVMESMEMQIPIHYVLEFGKNYLLAIHTEYQHVPEFRLEIIHLHTISEEYLERHPDSDLFSTMMKCYSSNSPLLWLLMLKEALQKKIVHVYNYYGNQLQRTYTPRSFLERLQPKPITVIEWDLRVNRQFLPKFQKQKKDQEFLTILLALDLKTNQKHPQDFDFEDFGKCGTFFEPLLYFSPFEKQDWYESMMIPRKKPPKRIAYKKSEYEPLSLYPSPPSIKKIKTKI